MLECISEEAEKGQYSGEMNNMESDVRCDDACGPSYQGCRHQHICPNPYL